MYHSSGISTLGRRALAESGSELDPTVHTFTSFLFSHNEKRLQQRVSSLTSRLQQQDAHIATLQALLAQRPPCPPPSEEHIQQEQPLPSHPSAYGELITELRARQAQRRSLTDITNMTHSIGAGEEAIPVVDDLVVDGADGLEFDDPDCEAEAEQSTASEADLHEHSRSASSDSAIASQVEGSLCSSLHLTHTTNPSTDISPASDCTPTDTADTAEAEEGQETGEVSCAETEAVTRLEGEVDGKTASPPRSPSSGVGVKRVREEEVQQQEGVMEHERDAAAVLSEWKRVKEERGSSSAEGLVTPLPSASVFLPTLLPPTARLLPFGSNAGASAVPLTPYRALSTRAGGSATPAASARSVTQGLLTSPMRLTTQPL